MALGPTQTTGWAPPAGLTNTSSSSNLVFPGGLPFRYWPGSRLGLGNQIAISTRGVIIWQGVENRHNTGPCSVLIWTCYFGCASCIINPDIKFHLVRFVNRINWLPHFLRTGSKERFVQVPNFTKWPAFLRNKMKTKLNATETVADLGFFKGRGHSGATIYRGGPSIMLFSFRLFCYVALKCCHTFLFLTHHCFNENKCFSDVIWNYEKEENTSPKGRFEHWSIASLLPSAPLELMITLYLL